MSSIKYQAGSPHVYWHSHFQACPLTPNPNHKQGPLSLLLASAESLRCSHRCPCVLLGPSVSVPTGLRGAIPLDTLTLLSRKRISVIPMGEPQLLVPHKGGPTTETDFLIGCHSTIYNLSMERNKTTGTGLVAERLSGSPPTALASIPVLGKERKR